MPQIPASLLSSLSGLPGFDEQAFVAVHENESRITSIRLNSFKPAELDFKAAASVPWAENAFYLDERPSFTLDPLFHAGCYYVQEAGSMFIEHALRLTLDLSQPLKVLDLCAAPGGKSTLINSLLNSESLLVANEFVRSRAEVLSQNLSRWGTANTIVTNNDPEKFTALTGVFDAMVVDAPCSGSGLFRKQPDAIGEWSESAVIACSIRQRKILADSVPTLKEGGILVYSTCSYSEEENETVVSWLVKEYGFAYVPLPVDKSWGIVETEVGYRFYPHLTRSEGFFCAVLRKTAAEAAPVTTKKIKDTGGVSASESAIIGAFVDLKDHRIIRKNSQFHLLNSAAAGFLAAFEKQLYFKKAGVTAGEIKGSDMIPNQELAWSLALAPAVSRLELDRDNALSFLRKENLPVPVNTRGLMLFTYKGYGIGWAKVLPNRINNYLPLELRILK